jgi:hypothetical protein
MAVVNAVVMAGADRATEFAVLRTWCAGSVRNTNDCGRSGRPNGAGNASPFSTLGSSPLGMDAVFLVIRMTRAE